MAIELLKFGTFIQQNSNRSFFESKLCQSLYNRDQEFKHRQYVQPINALNIANRCNIQLKFEKRKNKIKVRKITDEDVTCILNAILLKSIEESIINPKIRVDLEFKSLGSLIIDHRGLRLVQKGDKNPKIVSNRQMSIEPSYKLKPTSPHSSIAQSQFDFLGTAKYNQKQSIINNLKSPVSAKRQSVHRKDF